MVEGNISFSSFIGAVYPLINTHFVQHYRRDEARAAFVEVGCGHCGFPRLKRRAPEQTCDNWRPAERQEPVSES